jgi:hypothetical protein
MNIWIYVAVIAAIVAAILATRSQIFSARSIRFGLGISQENQDDLWRETLADAERYRYLCEAHVWPEEVIAVFDCANKVLIDAMIDKYTHGKGFGRPRQ